MNHYVEVFEIQRIIYSKSFQILFVTPDWVVSLTSQRSLYNIKFIYRPLIQNSFRNIMSKIQSGTFENMAQVGKCFVNWPLDPECGQSLQIGSFIFILFGIFGILLSCSLFIFCTFIRCKKRQPMVYQTRSGTLTRRPLV